MATPESESFVRTFARGLKIIETMGQGEARQTLADVAAAVELPRTAVRRFLMTLIELSFVKTDGKHYWLTPKVLRLGLSYLYTLPFWRQSQLALEELDDSIAGLAVPVRDQDGTIVAAINVSLPAGAYQEDAAVAEFLQPLRQTPSQLRSTMVGLR